MSLLVEFLVMLDLGLDCTIMLRLEDRIGLD